MANPHLLRLCLTFITVVLVVFSLASPSSAFNLTLMHTANTYAAVGAIDAYGGGCAPVNDTYLTSWGTPTCYGGMARMMTVVNDQRARSTNTLLVDAGSSLATSLYYYVHGPSIVAAYYAQLGYDFVHFQLEDFFLLVETVIEFMQVANAGALSMQFVASNLEGFNNDTRANGTFIAKWAFKSFAGGEKVGYAATVAKDLELMMRNPRDIHTTDEAAALLVAVIALMNKGANKIVASVSSNATAELVLANVPGIDILIVPGGQLQANDLSDIRSSAVGPYPMVRNTAWEQPVLVVSSGTYGRLVGVLDVTFDDYGVITSWSGDSVLMDESVVANTSVQAQLAADYAQVEAYFAQTVGWSAVDLSADAKCFFAECTIGDWAADSLRSFAMPTWGGNVQVGLINGGSINSALPQGPVTLGMQQSAFPFGTNALYTYLLKGRVLVAALENGLSLADDPTLELSAGAGRFLQVSGLRFSWNPKEAVGYRVIDAYVEVRPGSWALLDPGATYNVSSIDWLVVYGGDGFTMIADNATHVFKNGDNMNAVLLDALAKNVTDVPTGRITTTAATRRACIADDGSTCSNNGYCLTGACVCTVAGTNSASLCALSATHGSPGSSSETVLAIALGVSLPVTALLVLGVLTALLIFLLARRRREPDSWEIDVAELELGDQLGAGGFGEVYRAVWKGTDVAVKVVSANNAGKAAWDSFKQEVSVMTALRHPNVVLFMAASTKPPKMCIVMELMELGSLYELIHNELLPAIPLPLCLKMAYQAAKGMHFLHSSGIVHRDLKSLNLLLDSKWNLKVSDFGLTTFKADLKRATGDDVQGTIHWTAPEVLEDRLDVDYVQADVYSFGVIMWELITREQPYRGMDAAAIAVGVIRDALRPIDIEVQGQTIQWNPDFEAIMTQCWHQDATLRPSFLEVMSRLSALSTDLGNDNSTTSSGSSSSMSSSFTGGAGYFTHATTTTTGSTASSSSSLASSNRSAGHAAGDPLSSGNQPAPPTDDPLTVVFTDVAHADRLWETEPHAMREAVTLHNDLLRRLLRQHRGYESVFLRGNAAGEGYFCFVFSRPVDALRWCGEVQRELLKVGWPQDLLKCDYAQEESSDGVDGSVLFRGLRVRMGVHYGPTSRARDPLSHRYEYFGAAVKVATELTLRAEGGHVLVSDAAISATEAVISRDRFIKVGTIDVVLANGGSMLDMVDVHDMLINGLEERYPGWEHNATDDAKSCTLDTGSATVSSGAGSTEARVSRSPRLLGRPGDEPSSSAFIGSSNACRWIIPFEDLAIQEAHVGQGSYGFVSQGQWKGVTVGVKRFVKQRLDEDTMLRFREEAALLAELRHPNVVLFIGACVRSPNVCIVTEWIRKGSLRDVLADGSVKLPWPTRLGVVKGIALGLAYLHSQEPAPILHRDLKSSNVLIDESWNAKICDFGLARMKQENATMTRCGTPAWIAPEVILRERYTEKADIYSLGIVMWEVATRKLPFAGENLARAAFDVVEGKRPPAPPNAPKSYVGLMTACWHRKPHKRPSAEQVCLTIQAWMDQGLNHLGDAMV